MSEKPTPETAPLMHAAANESIEAMFRMGCQLEHELADANRIIKECLWVMPVGYIPSHTPENLPAKIEGLLKELAENTTIRHERVAEELAEVTKQRDNLIKDLEYIAHSGLSARHLADHAIASIKAMKGGAK